MTNSLTVDDLHFEIRRSPRRKSVQITVDRGGELLLFAPDHCKKRVMEQFVRAKRFWIYTKLAQKDALAPVAPARAPARKPPVPGEGFYYLGRSYRLQLVDEQAVPVTLEHNRLKMTRAATGKARTHLVKWYTARAGHWLSQQVRRHQSRITGRAGATTTGTAIATKGNVTTGSDSIVSDPIAVHVQDLGYRWGSCGKGGRLYFHWRTVLLPPRIIEYIAVHELVHLVEAHHTKAFWSRVERVLPDATQRKQWLAENGARFDV